MRDVPRMIIEHNIHGVDIDPRATQIAGLSLWLRAQRAWAEQGIPAVQRPVVRRSQIVCAEPMPGEKELLREFVEQEFPLGERAVFLPLLESVFDLMQLAGEAGSLLQIEEDIRSAIADAKLRWKATPRTEQIALFDEETIPTSEQEEMTLDLSGITDEEFWEKAEERIYDALRTFAESAGGGYQRRLFAEDAARGFAFIDLCRQRYDVALMNPPFGEPSINAIEYLRHRYSILSDNLYCGFFARMFAILSQSGFCGSITDRSFLGKQSYEPIRRFFVDDIGPQVIVDLGWEVLDANVETCAAICGRQTTRALFTDVGGAGEGKADELQKRSKNAQKWVSERLSTFATLPFCSFAYSMPEWMRRCYRSTRDRFENGVARVARGMAGANADHLYRVCFEVPIDQMGWDRKWAILQKGSPYSPFYFGPEQVILSENHSFSSVLSYNAGRVTGREDYGSSGLAFGKRTDFMYAYVMQPNQVFSVEGQAIFPLPSIDFWQALAIINSSSFQCLVNQICGQHKYHGYVNAVYIRAQLVPDCSKQSKTIWSDLCGFDSHNETARHFTFPRSFAIPIARSRLSELVYSAIEATTRMLDRCSLLHIDINEIVSSSLGASEDIKGGSSKVDYVQVLFGETDSVQLEVSSIATYLVGCAFGRWDIRYATGERSAPEPPDPFAPLPVCPPGMLQNAAGLPAAPGDVPASYPVPITWSGILVDDANHPDDIERRLREVLAVIFPDRTDAIVQEACDLLGVKSLREWAAKPAGLFADHLKRYSKSRRQAPIYWPLSTASGSYTLWIYYHRLTPDTLYKCLSDFVEPKIAEVEKEIHRLRTMIAAEEAGTRERKQLADAESLLTELREFHADLSHWAPRWKPNLNDGVQITASPLWKLFRLPKWQKTLKETWQKLEKGDYDWAHLALTLRPNEVREKCKKDRSLAIAHDLEDLCEIQAPVPKKKAAKKAAKKATKNPSEEQKKLL